MKTQEYLDLDPHYIMKMTEKELRKAVSTLRSTARKRYNRIIEKNLEYYSPAVSRLLKGGLLPDIKGMDIKTLRNEFKRYRHFLTMKTSTVKGIRAFIENMRENIKDVTGNDSAFSDNDMDILRFFDIYNKVLDTEIGSLVHYKVVMQAVEEIYTDNKDLSDDEIIGKATKKLESIYKKERFDSSFFEDFDDYDT